MILQNSFQIMLRMINHLNKIFVVLLLVMPVRGRTEAIAWSEILTGEFLPRRDEASYQFYLSHIKQLKSQNKTTEQVILEDVFKIKEGKVQGTAKETPDYRLIVNSFPYWLEENVAHLLVFSNAPNWDKDELNKATINILSEQLPALFNERCYEFSIHINVPEKRTIKGLAHSHVFIRSSNQNNQIYNLIRNIPFSRPGLIPAGWPQSNH